MNKYFMFEIKKWAYFFVKYAHFSFKFVFNCTELTIE